MRVTQSGQQALILSNLGDLNERLLNLRMQASSGYRMQNGSDDPAAYGQILSLQSQETLTTANGEVSSRLSGRLAYYDTVLGQVGTNLRSARNIALQAASSGTDNESLSLLATQVNQIIETVVGAANDQNEGRYIFAGAKVNSPPYVVTRVAGEITGVTYAGDDRPQDVTLDSGQVMRFSVSGSEVFGSNPASQDSMIGGLIKLRDDLKAGNRDAVQQSIATLDNLYNNSLAVRGEVGAREQHLQSLDTLRNNVVLQLQKQRDSVQNVDLPTTVSQLMQEQTVWQSALEVAARVDQYNLLSMLR